MDGKESVTILAWRQENVIMKKSTDLLRVQGHLQGRIGPAAPPPLRAVGPWLKH